MLSFQIGQATDTGKTRSVNQDALCALDLSERFPDSQITGLFVVADGMGGHASGEEASNYVIRELSRLFGSDVYRDWFAERGLDEGELALGLKEAIEAVSAQIYDTSQRRGERQKMGTTVTAALVSHERLIIGHVGDSRAYLIQDREITQLTRDHSWVNELVEQGILTDEQARRHQAKNIVTRSVGTDPSVQVDLYQQEIGPGEILFLCTDGLSNSVEPEEIQKHLLKYAPQKACERLVKLANQRDGSDNISCIAVRFETTEISRSKLHSRRLWILIGLALLLLGALAVGWRWYDPIVMWLRRLFS